MRCSITSNDWTAGEPSSNLKASMLQFLDLFGKFPERGLVGFPFVHLSLLTGGSNRLRYEIDKSHFRRTFEWIQR